MSSLPTASTAKQAESPDYRSVAIDDIIVKQRHRKDPGDIGKLAASMGDLGQLQPVLLDTHLNLIAGERRLLAAQKLGWERVDAHVVHNFDDAAKCLRAERDENICRKEMSVVELASLTDHLLEIEKAAAKERQRKHGGTAPGKNTPEENPEVSGKAIDRVAEAVGVSAPTLRGVQKIADAAVPELVELVDKGAVKIAPAAEVASLPAEEQKAIVKAGPAAVKRAAKQRKQAKAKRPYAGTVKLSEPTKEERDAAVMVALLKNDTMRSARILISTLSREYCLALAAAVSDISQDPQGAGEPAPASTPASTPSEAYPQEELATLVLSKTDPFSIARRLREVYGKGICRQIAGLLSPATAPAPATTTEASSTGDEASASTSTTTAPSSATEAAVASDYKGTRTASKEFSSAFRRIEEEVLPLLENRSPHVDDLPGLRERARGIVRVMEGFIAAGPITRPPLIVALNGRGVDIAARMRELLCPDRLVDMGIDLAEKGLATCGIYDGDRIEEKITEAAQRLLKLVQDGHTARFCRLTRPART